MSKNFRLALILIPVAALLIALGYWNIRPESFMERQASAQADENAIDFYVVNASSVQYQEDGKRHYEMTAAKLEHVKASDVTLLTNPDLQLYRGTEFPGTCRASAAKSAPKGSRWN